MMQVHQILCQRKTYSIRFDSPVSAMVKAGENLFQLFSGNSDTLIFYFQHQYLMFRFFDYLHIDNDTFVLRCIFDGVGQ